MNALRTLVDRGHAMFTFTGKAFYPRDPRPEDFCIEDIAHGLSFVCRFGGQCTYFYSVAQHSMLVATLVQRAGGTLDEMRWALLHDAPEAYLGDVVWPLKQAPEMAGYKTLEHEAERAMAEAFGLSWPMPGIVKHFDLVLLATEKRDIMNRRPGDGPLIERQLLANAEARLGGWSSARVEPHDERIMPLAASAAHKAFLAAWKDLEERRLLDAARAGQTRSP